MHPSRIRVARCCSSPAGAMRLAATLLFAAAVGLAGPLTADPGVHPDEWHAPRAPEFAPIPEPAAPLDAPTLMHYQGRFTDPGGVPLLGPVTLIFRLTSALQGGGVLWSETHDDVPLNEGVASVLLGSRVAFPADVFFSPNRFLEITVDGSVLTPRLRLASVPYALEANRLQGKTSFDFEPKGTVLGLSIGDGSGPNLGSNRMHWENLTGVPEGLADGVDDGASVHADLQGLDQDDHPQYLRNADAATSDGTAPNQGSNQVHWDNLTGVPSGFADGADNTGIGGASDHGELSGLEDDDHPHYALDQDLVDHNADFGAHSQYATDGELTNHTLEPDAHHSKTVDASLLTQGTLDADRLPPEGIDGSHVLDGSLTAADLIPGILDSLTLEPGAVDSVHLAAGAVRAVHLASGSVTSVALAPDAVGGETVIDSSLSGADVIDDTLPSEKLSDEPGVSFASDNNDVSLGATPTVILQDDIECPADGWVLAVATAQICVFSGPGDADALVEFSVTAVADVLDEDARVAYRVLSRVGENNCGSVTSQKLFPVTAGTQTFYIVAETGSSSPVEADQLGLSLVYFRTRY